VGLVHTQKVGIKYKKPPCWKKNALQSGESPCDYVVGFTCHMAVRIPRPSQPVRRPEKSPLATKEMAANGGLL
jgi:hypothetical protein